MYRLPDSNEIENAWAQRKRHENQQYPLFTLKTDAALPMKSQQKAPASTTNGFHAPASLYFCRASAHLVFNIVYKPTMKELL